MDSITKAIETAIQVMVDERCNTKSTALLGAVDSLRKQRDQAQRDIAEHIGNSRYIEAGYCQAELKACEKALKAIGYPTGTPTPAKKQETLKKAGEHNAQRRLAGVKVKYKKATKHKNFKKKGVNPVRKQAREVVFKHMKRQPGIWMTNKDLTIGVANSGVEDISLTSLRNAYLDLYNAGRIEKSFSNNVPIYRIADKWLNSPLALVLAI